MSELLSFTQAVLLGALISAVLGLATVALGAAVTRRRPGLLAVLGAIGVAGAATVLQLPLASDGFGRLHVLYLYVFVALPVIGAGVLLAGLSPRWRPRRSALVAGGGLLALAGVGFYATHIEPYRLRTERVTLDVEQLDGEEAIRIGVLSDIQTRDIGHHEHDAVDRILAEEPDLILVAGDYFQSDGPEFEAELPEVRALLARLEAPGGVYLVEGDVDSPQRMAFMTEGQETLTWLDEEVVTTRIRGQDVHIGGISVRYWDDPAEAAMDELAATGDDGDLRILLSHRPDAAFHVEEGDVDLVVAGHTHGGQVSLPFFGPPIKLSNVSREVAAGGLHDIEGVPIYLSNGVGLERITAPQVRLGSVPSVGVVTLV